MKITRTELVWPGKYDEAGDQVEPPRGSLPFQVIETVNVSRAAREAASRPEQRTLFDYWDPKEGVTFEEGWRNKLIWGDNLLVMNSLLERFEGKIDLIYIDPPFATGADFGFTTEVGDEDITITKEQSALEEKAYRDTWGGGLNTYLEVMAPRLAVMRKLLAPTGSFFLHCDWHVGHYLKVICDSLFGPDRFINEIAWCYTGPGSPGARQFSRKHDTIFWYSAGNEWTFNVDAIRVPHDEKTRANFRRGLKGSGFVAETYELAEQGKVPEDHWQIAIAARFPIDGVRRTGYATEKPWNLLERIVLATSKPGDLVADFFAGSGTAIAVAESHDRRWIGCDLGRFAIHVSRKRLLGLKNCMPFEILNLGKYERQYWQDITFGKGKDIKQQAIFQYLAFVLKLYKAQPVAGMEYLHGRRAGAMVHIGAVDAPVTIDEITHALDECAALKQKELHVLGWEWEMGLAGPNNDVKSGGLMHQAAKEKGIKLILLQIPREVMEDQAVQKGDVHFFELAYLDVAITKPRKLTALIKLNDFVIPNTDLIPDEVRAKVSKWSDYIDYWSVDWDFQNDTFIQGFVTYRTPKDRKLSLASDPHTYEKPGRYRVVVKVIDIFGNDTSQGYTVQV